METVEKCLKPLCGLKNRAGKLVEKKGLFHKLVHTNQLERERSTYQFASGRRISCRARLKTVRQKAQKFTVVTRFP